MLTRIKVKNFKKLDDGDVELGKTVVLIGPNNSGKTSAFSLLLYGILGLDNGMQRERGKPPLKNGPALLSTGLS